MSVPNSNYLAIFRADFSPIIGGGHVMRCLSIAHAFKKVGWKIVFASRSESVRDLAKLAGLHPHFIFLEGYDDARVFRESVCDRRKPTGGDSVLPHRRFTERAVR